MRDELINDQTLTVKKKAKIRNIMSAQVSRTRKMVELANLMDSNEAIQKKFKLLIQVLDDEISGSQKQKVIQKLETLFGEPKQVKDFKMGHQNTVKSNKD